MARATRARRLIASARPASPTRSRRASRSARRAGRSRRWPRRCRAAARPVRDGSRRDARRSTSFAMLFALGLAGRGYFKGDGFVAGERRRRRAAGRAASRSFPVVTDPDLRRCRTATAPFRCPRFPQRLFAEKIWGLGCIAGNTRCGVAWNTLLLALLCAAALHGARPRVRADRHAHRLHAQGAAARAHGPADHHAALRDRSRPHPALRPLGPRQPAARIRCSAGSSARWIYGLQGVLVAQVFAFTPIAFLVLIGVVEGVSPSIEEAAQTLRAGRWRVFADVSLPLMRPGLANAFLISFIESIADFGNPILLGGNFGVLSTEIFFSVVGAQLDQGRAATLGIVLLLFALGAFFAAARGARPQGLHVARRQGRRRPADAAARRRAARSATASRCRGRRSPSSSTRWRSSAASSRPGAATTRSRCGTTSKAFGIEWTPHGMLWAGAAWNSFWTTITLSAIAAPITAGARHPHRVPAHAPAIRRPARVRVRHDAVVRDSRHGDRRRRTSSRSTCRRSRSPAPR